MPIVRTFTRHLAAACLAVASLLVVAAGPVSALEPPRPLPDHRPAFVTETDEHPWKDCLWASAAMLLDKWTNGDVTRTHQQLRGLSRDAHGGSTFRDMHTAFARLGFSTPDSLAGQSLTWHQLLSRLRRGAGAVVLGDYGDLPRWFGRWDYGFWKRRPIVPPHPKPSPKPAVKPVPSPGANPPAGPAGKPKPKPKPKPKLRPDNHAIYVERYEPRHGRVWIMDPLARGGWHGEWISVRALKRFAWTSGGHVYAVTTPVAAPPPFAGVRFVQPSIGLSDTAVSATWQLKTPRRWQSPGGDVRVSIAAAASPLEAAARSALVAPVLAANAAPAKPTSGVAGAQLTLTAALPATPGAYTASLSLFDRRFGRQAVASDQVAVFVPGDQRATLRLNVNGAILTAGGTLKANVFVSNAGRSTWADPPGAGADGGPSGRVAEQRDTQLVGHWILLDDAAAGASTTTTAAATTGTPALGADGGDPGTVDLRSV